MSFRLGRRLAWLAWLVLLGLAACETPPPPPPPSPPPPVGLADLMDRPAERALLDGMRAYDEGQYVVAEAALKRALGAGLAARRDESIAHKLLAFISCSSDRLAECEAAFRAAIAADPAFKLGKSEAGHPMWGPVYERLRKP